MDRQLIAHCSPTLAGIKTANLFSYTFASREELTDSIRSANETLNEKGVAVEALRIGESRALILVYRESRLVQDWAREGVREFMSGYGYDTKRVGGCISRLKSRFAAGADFPHEIGLFLGYPLPDVMGFIENEGKNCKIVGCWKVYCDERRALELFAKYKKCAGVYSKLYSRGRPIERLTVSA